MSVRITNKPEPPEPDNIKINPNSIVVFKPRKPSINRSHFRNLKRHEETTTTTNEFFQRPNNKTNGFLSDRAGNRLRKSIKYLLWLSGCFKIINNKMILKPSGHISFITLTLCSEQIHDDNFIKKNLLNQFFTELNKKQKGIMYIWRAEKQKNGNIHFHILCNKYIPWSWIASTWNRLLSKTGYLDRYTKKFSNLTFEEYCKTITDFKINLLPKYKIRYLKGKDCNWNNPPSTHVEDMRSAKEIVFYMSKYLTKNSHDPAKLSPKQIKTLSIQGRQYYCSTEISSIKAPTEFVSTSIERELRFLQNISPDLFLYEDFYMVIRISIEELFNLNCLVLYNIFINNLNKLKPKDLFT